MMSKPFHYVRAIATLAALLVAGPVLAGANDGVEGLTAEQQSFAQRFLQFQEDMDERFFGRAARINGGHDSDVSETIEQPSADFYVRVARGGAVEKIGRMISREYEPLSDTQRAKLFGRYYGLDVHAKSPLMGHVHSAIVLQYYPDGRGMLGGTLNLLQGAARDADIEYVKTALDKVFEKHGRDSAPYRKRVCNIAKNAVQPKFHRKLACVGASFFGYPMMEVTEANFAFMTEIYATFISAYLDTLERRIDEPYTDADVAKQDAMRLNWTEDQFLGDPFSAGGIVPYEVWGKAFLPPVVRF